MSETNAEQALGVKNYPAALFRLMRPQQWIKNAFVFTGLLFAHQWSNWPMLAAVTGIAFAFCLMSSAVYVLNDLLDIENDRRHPTKCKRPLASGEVSPRAGILLGSLLAVTSLLIAGLIKPLSVLVLLSYGLMNVAYSIRLKHVVILDVFCIATGFMLRIIAGTTGVGIPPSQWLLLCGLMVTLFLGFAKRRAEILALAGDGSDHRKVLANYHPVVLDEMMGVCATGVILSYSLYTMSADTIAMHHTDQLIYTVPFVIYGLFRYLYLLHSEKQGGDPSRDLVRDKHIMAAVLFWLGATVFFIA
jgi:4-hydroxybenzoate polyprenyltransferase